MKKVFIALVSLLFGLLITSCQNQPAPQQPKTSIIVIKEGPTGNDTVKTTSSSYQRAKTDSTGVEHRSGRTTTTAVVHKGKAPETIVEMTTQPEQNQPAPEATTSTIPWWAWTLLALFAFALLVGMIVVIIRLMNGRRPRHHVPFVMIAPGGNIDMATQATIRREEAAFRDRHMAILEKGINENRISEYSYTSDLFSQDVKFR